MTPLRQQYLRIKKRFPGAIVLFRLGDFYESFDDDARIVSEACNIVLTARDMGGAERVPLAGVPYHAIETYLAKLIQAGHKVAIVEQLEAADSKAPGRTLITRDVTRVVTPGTVVEPVLLEDKRNNYLAALVADGERVGLAYVDITTGEFAAAELDAREVRPELGRLSPAEVLISDKTALDTGIKPTPVRVPDFERADSILREQFQVAALDAFGLSGLPLATRAAATIVEYLAENQKAALAQFHALRTYSTRAFMTLDPATRRNLELVATIRTGAVKGSLLGVLDETRTPMGARLLRQWLTQPLLDLDALNARLDRVDAFYRDTPRREGLRALLKNFPDLERLTNRVVQGIATPRDVVAIKVALERVTKISNLQSLASNLDASPDIAALIARAIVPDPPGNLGKGGVIARGFSAELDGITASARNAKDWVASLERKERERTGVKSLKVGYNKVFGYYIEVTTPNLPQVPAEYIRKQTLTNAERYITPELKEYESLILNAEERLIELETTLFRQVCAEISSASTRLLQTARGIAELDVYAALAEVAIRNRYIRPTLTTEDRLEIQAGRHPVVEQTLKNEPFVPNDVHLDDDARILVITGPNMSGKSTWIRQVAMIVLMAQIGSFVPAEAATIGLVDRIFTRIGAQDEISAGQSTFMVEMVEAAHILHHATRRSLIVLDEIGRGTSTFDGIAIARAMVEHIHNHPNLCSKTLFATHYHELTELEDYLPKVRNFNVAVLEQGDQVIFLHKIVPGGADKSYGIHVAQLAGIPRPVVHRAEEILDTLENGHRPETRDAVQLAFFPTTDPLRDELAQIDVLSLSPLEALNKLFELSKKAKGEK